MVAGRADHGGDPAGLVARHFDSLQAQSAGDLTDDRVEDLVCRRPFSDARRNAALPTENRVRFTLSLAALSEAITVTVRFAS